MYDREITDRALHAASQKVGFKLQRFSEDQCLTIARRLSKLRDPETGKLARSLTPNERRFVDNERVVCKLDFEYFSRYAWIIPKEGFGAVQFRHNRAQGILLSIAAEHERRRISIEVINDKARQLGVSTWMQIMIAHRVQFWHYVTGLMASSDEPTSKRMAKKTDFLWKKMPWYLMPQATVDREGTLTEFGHMNSRLYVEWLNKKGDLARGDTPHAYHISEVAWAEDPESKIDSGLLRATHSSSRLLGWFESTAKIKGDWWNNTWDSAVKYWSKGESRLRPIFLPYFVGDDLYPNANWLESHPVPVDWTPMQLTIAHAERAAEYVKRDPLLRSTLGMGWKLSREQMWWWQTEYEEHKRKRALDKFYRECASSADESFQVPGGGIFDVETISIYRTNKKEPLMVCGLRGHHQEIPIRHQPYAVEIVEGEEGRTITCDNNSRFDLIPLRYDNEIDPMGKLFIWEWPADDCEYGIGIDTGAGVGKDRTVFAVMRKSTLNRGPRVVAEFASDLINATEAIPFAYAIGSLYSVRVNGFPTQPKWAIEVKGEGPALQRALREMGFGYHHEQQRWNRYQDVQTDNPIIGVMTDERVRRVALDHITSAVRGFALEIDSPWAIDELASLTVVVSQTGRSSRVEHAKGQFDDRVFAMAFIYMSLHETMEPEARPKTFGWAKRFMELTDAEKYPSFPGDDQTAGMNAGPDVADFMKRFHGFAPEEKSGEGQVEYVR